jgi:hypothetical protein
MATMLLYMRVDTAVNKGRTTQNRAKLPKNRDERGRRGRGGATDLSRRRDKH